MAACKNRIRIKSFPDSALPHLLKNFHSDTVCAHRNHMNMQWPIYSVIHAHKNKCNHPCMLKNMQPSTHVTMHASMHASTCMTVWMDVYMNQAIECHILWFGDQHAALAALNSLWGPRLGNKKFITNSRSIFLLPHNNVQIFPNK